MMKRFETSGWWVLLVAPVFLAAACAGEGGGKSSRITLADPWARRDMKICVQSLAVLPAFARELVDALAEHAPTRPE